LPLASLGGEMRAFSAWMFPPHAENRWSKSGSCFSRLLTTGRVRSPRGPEASAGGSRRPERDEHAVGVRQRRLRNLAAAVQAPDGAGRCELRAANDLVELQGGPDRVRKVHSKKALTCKWSPRQYERVRLFLVKVVGGVRSKSVKVKRTARPSGPRIVHMQ